MALRPENVDWSWGISPVKSSVSKFEQPLNAVAFTCCKDAGNTRLLSLIQSLKAASAIITVPAGIILSCWPAGYWISTLPCLSYKIPFMLLWYGFWSGTLMEYKFKQLAKAPAWTRVRLGHVIVTSCWQYANAKLPIFVRVSGKAIEDSLLQL